MDRDRIYRVTEALQQLWLRYPELSLQEILWSASLSDTAFGPDDDEYESRFLEVLTSGGWKISAMMGARRGHEGPKENPYNP